MSHVNAVDIADDPPAEQGVPEIGIEFHLLGLAAPFDLDAAEPAVPVVARLADHAIEVPVGKLFFAYCMPRVGNADIGNRHLHQQRLVALGEGEQCPGVLAFDLLVGSGSSLFSTQPSNFSIGRSNSA